MSLRLLIYTITQYSITARRCANRMILRSCCFLGTPHRGRARKALRASWGPSTTTVSTHIRTIYAHTQHKHGMEESGFAARARHHRIIYAHRHTHTSTAWRRVDSQRGPDTIASRQRHPCHCGVSHLHLGAEALAPRIVHRIPSL